MNFPTILGDIMELIQNENTIVQDAKSIQH